jgi:hypothetical protein
MMKFTKTICAAVLLSSIAWTSVAHAEDSAGIGTPEGSYSGGGYRVTVRGREYIGFDRQGKKLVLSEPLYRVGSDTVEFKNKGYTYRLTPSGKHRDNDSSDGDYTKVLLTITNPQGRTILKQVMNNVR